MPHSLAKASTKAAIGPLPRPTMVSRRPATRTAASRRVLPAPLAAAWSLVHGLSHLLLDGHFAHADREAFLREVLGAVRFAQRAA